MFINANENVIEIYVYQLMIFRLGGLDYIK